MSIWLEICACRGTSAGLLLDHHLVQRIPVLSLVLAAGQQASQDKRHPGLWDYSQKITQNESEEIKKGIVFTNAVEDTRSTVFSVDISYFGSCYTLRLFYEKSQ